jgi:hypothetical protein
MITNNSEWIIAHRGLWTNRSDQNSHFAISTALNSGFAVESDFRDIFGDLVISHDLPSRDNSLLFDVSWSEYRIAYNIKSDGMSPHFQRVLQSMNDTNSFVFDGSIPEMFKIRNLGIPHALRLSEYESELSWDVKFVWVDGFNEDWWLDNTKILSLLESRHVIFVSPELHGREHERAFDWFSELRVNESLNFSVCTDYPLKLKELNE